MKKYFLFIIVLFISGGLYSVSALEEQAEQTANDVPVVTPFNLELIHFYDTELFRWVHGGFGNVTLMYQNQSALDRGFFRTKINNHARTAFSLYEETHREIQSFDSKTTWSRILFWGGLAAVTTGSILMANSGQWVSNDPYCYNRNRKLKTNYAMMGTGIGLAVIGGISFYVSPFVFLSRGGNLDRAVNLFNRQRVLEFANAPSMLTPR